MSDSQSDLLTIVAGERRWLGPRYVWGSTGDRVNLSGLHGKFTIADYPGGTTLGTLSTSSSTSVGLLKFSAASVGRYFLLFKPPLTSTWGGVDAWWQFATSAAGASGPIIWQRGKLQIKQKLG